MNKFNWYKVADGAAIVLTIAACWALLWLGLMLGELR